MSNSPFREYVAQLTLAYFVIISCPLVCFADNGCYGKLSDQYCKCNSSVIECRNANYTDTDIFLSITADYFRHIDTIIITGNRFRFLERYLFGPGVKHSKLTKLDLSNNGIQAIHHEAFYGMPNLELLDLSHNNITIKPRKGQENEEPVQVFDNLPNLRELRMSQALAVDANLTRQIDAWNVLLRQGHLTNLETLDLSSNGFIYVPRDFFCSFTKLMTVNLANNSLRAFHTKLECMVTVVDLDLARNSFKAVSSNFTSMVDNAVHLRSVKLSDNPFRCDCQAKTFIRWLQTRDRVVDKKHITCDYALPNDFLGLSLQQVPAEKLLCDHDDSKQVHTVHIWIGLSTVGLITVLLCLMYTHKSRCLKRLRSGTKSGGNFGYAQLKHDSEVQPEFV